MKILAKFYLVLCWAFLIIELISFPVYDGGDFGFSYVDKIIHLLLFAVLTYLLLSLFQEFLKKNWQVFLGSFFVSLSYSLFTEYIQIFVPGRDASSMDFLAGALGALLAILFVKYLSRTFLRGIRTYRKVRDLSKPRLLLHVCCVGCGVYISQLLGKDYQVVLYFYNPSIYPEEEYKKRLNETKKIARQFRLKLIIGEYNHQVWLEKIKGLEKEPEKGKRCKVCYQDRLKNTARLAKERKIRYFATTLTISPHKDARIINRIGKSLEKKHRIYPSGIGVKFIDIDFKKKDGFKKSAELAKKLGLYRQDYCGCEFSRQ